MRPVRDHSDVLRTSWINTILYVYVLNTDALPRRYSTTVDQDALRDSEVSSSVLLSQAAVTRRFTGSAFCTALPQHKDLTLNAFPSYLMIAASRLPFRDKPITHFISINLSLVAVLIIRGQVSFGGGHKAVDLTCSLHFII